MSRGQSGTGPAGSFGESVKRRHPAEVTSDRLAEASERWYDRLTGEERDMIGLLRHALEQIAEGMR
jgi:hypothetical protein